MARKSKAELEMLILELLESLQEVDINHVAKAANMSKDVPANRRSIQRAFKALSEKGSIEPHGRARARVYSLVKKEVASVVNKAFQGIKLTKASEALLQYLSQPIHARKPVSYNHEFLELYIPNKTFYLDKPVRVELLLRGKADDVVKPAGTYAREILSRLLIDLSWNSSRLEGNTYSLLETKRLFEQGEGAEGKDIIETQMLLNHKAAIEYIVDSPAEGGVSFHEICSIHALLSENLLGDPGATGRIRTNIVGISGSSYLPLENPHLLRQYLHVFTQKFNEINDPFEQSIFALINLSYLQAFADVNKRTARLVANIPFIKNNLKPMSFVDVNQDAYVTSLLGIYEKNDISLFRDFYVWAYQRSADRYSAVQQSLAQLNPIKFKYRNQIREIIRTVVIEKTIPTELIVKIKKLINTQNIAKEDENELFNAIEIEIMNLHEDNIARFGILPQEFHEWKIRQ